MMMSSMVALTGIQATEAVATVMWILAMESFMRTRQRFDLKVPLVVSKGDVRDCRHDSSNDAGSGQGNPFSMITAVEASHG